VQLCDRQCDVVDDEKGRKRGPMLTIERVTNISSPSGLFARSTSPVIHVPAPVHPDYHDPYYNPHRRGPSSPPGLPALPQISRADAEEEGSKYRFWSPRSSLASDSAGEKEEIGEDDYLSDYMSEYWDEVAGTGGENDVDEGGRTRRDIPSLSPSVVTQATVPSYRSRTRSVEWNVGGGPPYPTPAYFPGSEGRF